MTSNSSIIITNEATGPSFSSQESERKGSNKPHQENHITDFRKDHSRGEAMVEEVYTIRRNDPR